MAGRERWPGGFVRQTTRGPVYVIEREVMGVRFKVSTRTHTLKAAMAHLEAFEKDPARYSPTGALADRPLYATAEMVLEYRAHLLEKKRSWKHCNDTTHRLNEWLEFLEKRNLKSLAVADIKAEVARRRTSKGARIAALKAFFGWLRKERGLLKHAEDITLDIRSVQAAPENRRRSKVVELERVAAVLPHLQPELRDVMLLLCATGWHFTEVQRFVKDRTSEVVETGAVAVVAVLITRHKGGGETRTPVGDVDTLAAAKRLKARGQFPRWAYRKLAVACAKAGVQPFTWGNFRHTVATYAVQKGATVPQASEFLSHKSPRTTARWYVDLKIPTLLPSVPSSELLAAFRPLRAAAALAAGDVPTSPESEAIH